MKKILLAFMVCVLCLNMCVFSTSANSAIEIAPLSYKSISSGVRVLTNSLGIPRGNYASYEVDFTNLPTSVEIIVGTDKSSAGFIELRLGSEKGEIFATIDTKQFLTQDVWGKMVCSAAIKKELKGKQTIFVCYGGYTFDLHSITFYGSKDGIKRKMLSQPVADEFRDIADETHKSKINALAQLGILDEADGTYNPKLPMTRRMFASMLGKAINSELYAQDTIPFSDISKDDPDAKVITGLYNLGIINGTPEGEFNPLGFIKPYEAAIICTRALGYTFTNIKEADLWELAMSLKLFRGVDSSSVALTKSDGAAIIYRMLLSDFMMPHSMANGNIVYESQRDVIHKYSHIKYGKGVVTENNYTTLYKGKKIDGTISIDGKDFLSGDTDAASYLGVLCEYFYTEENGENILKSIVKCDSVDITVFESLPNQKLKVLSERAIEYYEDDELYEFELDSQTSIIYNAVSLDAPLSSLINVNRFMGKIIMIDNDGDGVLDCVWIDSAQNVVVGGINGNRIYDMVSETTIDMGNDEFELYVDGIPQMLKTLKNGTVLTVYRSVNKTGDKLIRATSALKEVKGMISELKSEIAVIGDEEYIISADCTEDLDVGDNGVFYLNDFSHIVRFEKEADALMVGCLLGVDPGQGGLNTTWSVRLLTEDKGIVVVDAAERIVADGITVKSATKLYEGTGVFGGLSNVRLLTPVLYKLDSEGKLSFIDTVESGNGGKSDGLTRLAASDSYRHYGGVLITASGWTMKHPVDSKAKIIQLAQGNLEEHYKIVTGLSAGDTPFTAVPYASTSDSMIADIVVWENCTKDIKKWSAPFVLTKISTAYDETQNTVVPCLFGYTTSAKVTYMIDETAYNADSNFKTLVDSLKVGDILSPATTNGRLTGAEIVLLASRAQSNQAGINALLYPGTTHVKDGGTEKGRVVFGKVVRVENGYIRLQYDSPEKCEVFKVSGADVASVEKPDSRGITVTNKMNNTSIFEGQYIVGHVNKVSFQMTSAFILHDIVSE